MAEYVAVAQKGKVGKARQVAPIKIVTKARSGDIDAIASGLVSGALRYAGRRRGLSASVTVEGPTGHYSAMLYCGEDVLAVFDIDTIEE